MRVLFSKFLDFLLPFHCPSCGVKIDSNTGLICKNCINKIKLADKERIKDEFSRKFSKDNYLNDFTSLFIFEKEKELQTIIHRLKYEQKFLLGKYLGQLIFEGRKDRLYEWQPDLIIPVPLHHLKKAERGFNQSLYLARGIAVRSGIPVGAKYIIRHRYTESQTRLSQSERELNVKDAFKLRKLKQIEGKKILLIDDVITTGATINECARILRNNGADKIYAVSVAIAD
ncbi:MAG: ComF family protein [Ignavibacteriaceae bacterium]